MTGNRVRVKAEIDVTWNFRCFQCATHIKDKINGEKTSDIGDNNASLEIRADVCTLLVEH